MESFHHLCFFPLLLFSGGPSGHEEQFNLVLTGKQQNELAGLLHFAVLCGALEGEEGNQICFLKKNQYKSAQKVRQMQE